MVPSTILNLFYQGHYPVVACYFSPIREVNDAYWQLAEILLRSNSRNDDGHEAMAQGSERE